MKQYVSCKIYRKTPPIILISLVILYLWVIQAPSLMVHLAAQSDPKKGFIEGAETFNEDFQRVQNVLRAVPKHILPSVVQLNISALKDSPNNPNFLFDLFRDNQNMPDEPRKYRSNVMGSGVIFRKENNLFFLMTNNHVVEDANEIEVITHDGRKFPGKIVGRDERVDLSVVSFEVSPEEARVLRVAQMGDSSMLEIGDWVMAVGSPNGFQSSVTIGIVSYIGRHGGPGQNINDFIQTDAAINHGNSGGPLVNMRGEVVGINTWIASESGSNAGLGFAIPINNTKYIVDSFLKDGKVRYGWLGIVIQEYAKILNRISPTVERSVLRDYGVYSLKGVFITSVYEGSPADKAGLQPGDFVTAVNNKKISSIAELTFSVGIILPGLDADLKVLRDGRYKKIKVKLGERKEEGLLDSESYRTWPGLDVIPLDQDIIKALKELNFNLGTIHENKKAEGLWILRVIPRSAGDMSGLQPNDIITQMNGQNIRTLKDFYRLLNEIGSDKDLVYTYKRQGKEGKTTPTNT